MLHSDIIMHNHTLYKYNRFSHF